MTARAKPAQRPTPTGKSAKAPDGGNPAGTGRGRAGERSC
jgi:hypothetical protein